MQESGLERSRAAAGLTVAGAAERLGVTPARLAAWERGDGEPGYWDLGRMARLYGVSGDALIGITC